MEPNQKPKTNAKDFFLNLGAIVALYTVVVSLLNLLFTIIDTAYPLITNGYNYYGSQSISWPVSILIIFFPILILLMWFLAKQSQKDSVARSTEGGFREFSTIRKWLSYITLFISGLTLASDLITVLYYFIDGQELTTGFVLKVVAVFVVTLSLFLYYISDIRGKLNSSSRKIWRIISAVIIIGSIVWGFSVLGSPRTQRLIKYDEQKVSDLQNINNQINSYYYNNKNVLPSSLSDISQFNYASVPIDQQGGELYGYDKKSEISYWLCAEFNTDSRKNDKSARPYRDDIVYGGNPWTHPAGHYCFVLIVNQQNAKGLSMPTVQLN